MPKKKRILTDEEEQKIKLVKKELNQYKNDSKYILEKLDDVEKTKTTLEKVTSILAPGKTYSAGGSKDKFADGISKLETLRKQLGSRAEKLIEKKFDIDDKIDVLPAPYRDVLFYRYARGYKWSEVAEKANYDKDYVYDELRPEALFLYSKLS